MSGFRRVLLKANVKEKLKACKKSVQTAIITMIELGLTKEQILTKYSEEDYLKAEEALNN